MITASIIFEIHQLNNLGLSIRKIAKSLHIGRKTVEKYLKNPVVEKLSFDRPSKLDPFKDQIDLFLETEPDISAQVIRQRLVEIGYTGGKSILCDYLKTIRQKYKHRRAFIRFESLAGEQFQMDWGHFESLTYGKARRKLYCMGVIECHSRMLYLEFTHSQCQESLHQCLLNAFIFFGGTPRELVHDNMLTAVTERDGPLIRFNDGFLNFLRPFQIVPKACHPRQPQEKGKVEKGAIHYIRHNFWPLRTFKDLADVQDQAIKWRDEIANVRVHRTTGERPVDRFKPEALRPLPDVLPDCRQTQSVKVYKDFAVNFDSNTYSVPPWLIGKQLTLRADHHRIWLFFKEKQVAIHSRCWDKLQRIELPGHRSEADKHRQKHWISEEAAILMSMGEEMKSYLEILATTHHNIRKTTAKLLSLKRQYGAQALIQAVCHAASYNAYGPEYIENILRQQQKPLTCHPPVKLQNEALNRIRIEAPLLAEYDAFVVQRRQKHDRSA